MSVVCCKVEVSCDGPITRPEVSFRVWFECDREASVGKKAVAHQMLSCQKKKTRICELEGSIYMKETTQNSNINFLLSTVRCFYVLVSHLARILPCRRVLQAVFLDSLFFSKKIREM